MIHLNAKQLDKNRQKVINAINQEIGYKNSRPDSKRWWYSLTYKSKIRVYTWILDAHEQFKNFKSTPLDLAFMEMPALKLTKK